MIPVTMIDITGLQAAADVIENLKSRGIEFVAAGRETEWRQWAEGRRLQSGYRSFPTLRAALKGYTRENLSQTDPDAPSSNRLRPISPHKG